MKVDDQRDGSRELIVAALIRLGLIGPGKAVAMAQLTGGVSSDIWRVDLPGGPVCIKRALPRLRVAAHWEAPIERNRYEYEWLCIAAEAVPGCVPRVMGRTDDSFSMEFKDLPVWKAVLRDGKADRDFAGAVGMCLRRIHDATAASTEIAARFPTDAIFRAIRIEPYLIATSQRHPDLAIQFTGLAERTAATKECLVHGDVSPKNILVGSEGPVFLDAECAWYGDPAFDLAFCLNHLLLKCLWVPAASHAFLQCFDALVEAYGPGTPLERRAASLLPALLLARVDGKSPVEYLDATAQQHVRHTAIPLVAQPPTTLEEVRRSWQRSLT